MEETQKTKVFFNRAKCNVTQGWFRQTQALRFSYPWCVDGFSRRIMWLKVTRSNNSPVVPASYYLETVSALKLRPTLLQTDCGTENNITAAPLHQTR